MQWFEDIKPWSPHVVDNERVVSIRIYGALCHAQSPKFFNLLIASIGVYLHSDDDTSIERSFDVARVMIRTKGYYVIEKIFNLKVDGIIHSIKVMEDSYGLLRLIDPNNNNVKDDTSSGLESNEDESYKLHTMMERERVEETKDINATVFPKKEIKEQRKGIIDDK